MNSCTISRINRSVVLYFHFIYCSMFVSSCKRLRIMKGSEARGLTCVWELIFVAYKSSSSCCTPIMLLQKNDTDGLTTVSSSLFTWLASAFFQLAFSFKFIAKKKKIIVEIQLYRSGYIYYKYICFKYKIFSNNITEKLIVLTYHIALYIHVCKIS